MESLIRFHTNGRTVYWQICLENILLAQITIENGLFSILFCLDSRVFVWHIDGNHSRSLFQYRGFRHGIVRYEEESKCVEVSLFGF